MHKEKREKTTETYVPFPEGFHIILVEPSGAPDEALELGRINLISILIDDEIAFVGAIHFHEDVKKVANDPYPLAVTYIPEGGVIHFHVQGAARNFDDNNVDPPFRFVFDGTCEETPKGIVLSGSGGVPLGFFPTRPPSEPGESVNWTSRGPSDKHPKPSK